MRRVAVDLVFAVLVTAAGLLALDEGPPPVPPGLCLSEGEGARPRRDLLAADGRITIAALFAQMSDGRLRDDDHGFWSLGRFVAALEAAGYRRVAEGRFERTLGDGTVVVVDMLGPRSLPREEHAPAIGKALGEALATHEVIYYNGGAYGGALRGLRRPPADYRILILDSCWSLQYYAAALLGPADLVVNRERAITGSVDSFLAVMEHLVEPDPPPWATLLATMNEAAARRASARILHPRFRAPEHYGLAVSSDGRPPRSPASTTSSCATPPS